MSTWVCPLKINWHKMSTKWCWWFFLNFCFTFFFLIYIYCLYFIFIFIFNCLRKKQGFGQTLTFSDVERQTSPVCSLFLSIVFSTTEILQNWQQRKRMFDQLTCLHSLASSPVATVDHDFLVHSAKNNKHNCLLGQCLKIWHQVVYIVRTMLPI